jgi:xanthine/CO dehydrogenase XdhC/CoxF family maturation factor
MKGLAEILRAWAEARGRGEPAVLATVVRIAGSSYRRPGARMFFTADGEPIGFISGGCLEGDLAEHARTVLGSGETRTLVYDMRSPDDIVWGLGLGCSGEIRVLLERLAPDDPPPYLGFIEERLARREPGVVATLFDVEGSLPVRVGERLTLAGAGACQAPFDDAELLAAATAGAETTMAAGRSRVESLELAAGRVEVLFEYLPSPVSLHVYGAGSDAQPLVRLAAELGWRVTVLDHRAAYAAAERFPEADSILLLDFDERAQPALAVDERTAVIVMTHHFLHDLELLKRLLPCAAPYVGLLGPKQRTATLLEQLETAGFRPDREQLRRLHGPAGVDIGSETPEEIALSVLCEIQAVLAGREAGFLRDRSGPLHDWAQ